MTTPIHTLNKEFDKEDSLVLLDKVIELRNKALKEDDIICALDLTHVIAWMTAVIEERWKK